jgi:hypothetical protein
MRHPFAEFAGINGLLRADQNAVHARVCELGGTLAYEKVKSIVGMVGAVAAAGLIVAALHDFSQESVSLYTTLALRAERELAESN